MNFRLTLAGLLLLAGSLAVRAEDWPGWRGPTRQGISAERGVPLRWTASEHVAWKTPIPGESWSSPIVWQGRVFVTTATDGGASCRVLALALDSGRVLWNREVFRQTPGHKQDKNSYATPTPVTDGQRVYAVFGDGSFAALSPDGEVIWTNRQTKFYSQHGLGASPLVYGELLIMPFDGSSAGPDTKVGWQTPWEQAAIVALDTRTGQERWRGVRGPSRIAHVSPVVVSVEGRDELVSAAGDAIQGFDLASGQRLWHVFSEGEGVVPSPAVGDGLIFTASGFGKTTLRTVKTGGRGDATKSLVAWEQPKGTPNQSSLLYVAPYLYAIDAGGVASCYRGETGDVVWQRRIGGAYCASPVYADGRIYLLSEEGETTVIAAAGEFRELARNPLGEKCQASMAVSAGRLLIRSQNHLWCIAGDSS